MKLYICKDYNEMSEKAAQIVGSVITLKPDCVLGLATGSTPVGMYTRLAEMNKEGKLDFAEVKTYNLDEYYPIKPTNDQSYRYFMDKNLFDNINIDKANTHVLNGEAADPEAECAAYDKAVEAAGGIDIQVLGIGNNGHIGFNEPADKLVSETHKTSLTESTINANARFFESANDVPRHALTMGLAPIMKAKKIIMLVSGKNKHAALMEMLSGAITVTNPSTVLNLHNDVTVVCDEDAYNG
ncbi:MAG: glucosamine-6-phosphate deaminase [Clostridiales bacterium]|nr:glucosamine-6-phosphate deaminase [Clostridiales bacterium]